MKKIGFLVLILLSTCIYGEGINNVSRIYHVNNRSNQAADNGNGSPEQPFKTISAAAKTAEPGDIVLVHAGVYRELVQPVRSGSPGKPIVFQAAEGETAVIRGSDVFSPEWQAEKNSDGTVVYRGFLDDAMFANYAMPWSKTHWYTDNPFRTKIMISNSGTKTAKPEKGLSQWARPWPPKTAATATEDASVSFDTDNRTVVYDGPPGTLPRTLGQIFVDGEPVQQVRTPEEVGGNQNTFIVAPDGKSLLLRLRDNADPRRHLVEITTRAQIFCPAKRRTDYIHVRGFIMEHCANQGPFPQAGALSTRSGANWKIENNVIRYATTVGIDCGGENYEQSGVNGGPARPENNEITGNVISDNGLCGIAVYSSNNVRISGNVLERNNRMGFTPGIDIGWWEQAAIKLHNCPGAVISDNMIRDNDCFGIWLDTYYAGARISRNLIVNNMFAGIFLECSSGPLMIDNNVVGLTRTGHGVYAHDSSGMTIANNLLFRNAHFGVLMRNVSNRKVAKGEICSTSDNKVLNNIILGNGQGAVAIPVKSGRDKDNISDYNVISGGSHLYDNGPVLFALLAREDRQLFKSAEYAGLINAGKAFELHWKDEEALFVDFDNWRSLTGRELHSLDPFTLKDSYMTFRSRLLNWELDLPEAVVKLRAVPVPDITRDYFGGSVDYQHGAVAGPFQKLKTGRNIFYLWPKQILP